METKRLFGAWLTDSRGQQTAERWCEDTEAAGLRFVGFADELASDTIRHKGWYTDPDGFGGEVYRGAVWQLPARNGKCLYVAGFVDPCNEGAALIDFDPIYGTPEDGSEIEAAHRADSIARIHAEHEREYREKWQAAQRVRDLLEDICDARIQHTALIRAIWTGERDDAIGARLRAACRDSVRRARREIAKLIDDYGADILTDEYA